MFHCGNRLQRSSVSNLVTVSDVTLFKDPARCRLEVKYAGTSAAPVSLAPVASTPFQLELSGLPGQSSYLEASTNLILWEPLDAITLPAAPFIYTDADSENSLKRFYRTRLP